MFPSLEDNKIDGARVLRFHDSQISKFPVLARLAADFELCALQVQHKAQAPSEGTDFCFIIAHRNSPSSAFEAFSPFIESLAELEIYASTHQIDLLHRFLFGKTEDDEWQPSCIMF